MSTIKMFLALFMIGSGVYVGAKIIPPFFENYQFQDAVKSEATLDTYTSKNENDIRTAVFRKAQDLEIPITEEQIHVHCQGMQASGLIIIPAPFVLQGDLPGSPRDLPFDATRENKGVL